MNCCSQTLRALEMPQLFSSGAQSAGGDPQRHLPGVTDLEAADHAGARVQAFLDSQRFLRALPARGTEAGQEGVEGAGLTRH